MKHLHRFFSSDASGVIISHAVLAMITNSGATVDGITILLRRQFSPGLGHLRSRTCQRRINDALMAVFSAGWVQLNAS